MLLGDPSRHHGLEKKKTVSPGCLRLLLFLSLLLSPPLRLPQGSLKLHLLVSSVSKFCARFQL